MAAIPGNEQWYIKENGGSGESVGIASTRSNWFIAQEVLRDNAEMICRLWNEQAADTKEQNFNNHQHSNGGSQSSTQICPHCGGSGRTSLALRFGESCQVCGGEGKLRHC